MEGIPAVIHLPFGDSFVIVAVANFEDVGQNFSADRRLTNQ